jgi:DNA-directed RNA polymerase specialized sigma24 family protein
MVRAFGKDDELRLMLAAQSGDSAAFGALYRRWEPAMLSFFARAGAPAVVRADLTAETFAAALMSLSSFQPQLGTPVGWLFGIARRVLWRSWQRGRVEALARQRLGMPVLFLDDEDLAGIDAIGDGPAVSALAALPPAQRAAVEARIVEELEYADIAVALQCSEQVARKRVSRGLAALRARMEDAS